MELKLNNFSEWQYINVLVFVDSYKVGKLKLTRNSENLGCVFCNSETLFQKLCENGLKVSSVKFMNELYSSELRSLCEAD